MQIDRARWKDGNVITTTYTNQISPPPSPRLFNCSIIFQPRDYSNQAAASPGKCIPIKFSHAPVSNFWTERYITSGYIVSTQWGSREPAFLTNQRSARLVGMKKIKYKTECVFDVIIVKKIRCSVYISRHSFRRATATCDVRLSSSCIEPISSMYRVKCS